LLVLRHPLHGALALIGTMVSLAGLYSLLAAPFLGVVQILTYAGAIMMLLVFVIMVLNSAHDHDIPRTDWKGIVLLLLPAGLAALLISTLQERVITVHPGAIRGSAQEVSKLLFNTETNGPGTWLLFVIVGLLLLAAMVSAVLLAKKRLDTPRSEVK
jgi:NADH-quinone oxidoreductase subunit J